MAKQQNERPSRTKSVGGAPLPIEHQDERVRAWDEWADKSYGRAIYYLDKARKCHLDAHLKQYGLSSAHMPVLTYLWEGHDGDTQSVIADVVGVDPATVTRVAQKLENLGYITRRISGRDARALHISLTPAGWALAEPVMAVSSEWTDDVTAGMSPRRRAEVLRMLQNLAVRAQDACATAKPKARN